jgi:hypothetical protein
MVVIAILAAVVCAAATVEFAISGPIAGAPTATHPALQPQSTTAGPFASPAVPAAPHLVPPPALPPVSGDTPSTAVQANASLEPDLVLLGSWTVTYVVGQANGNGANVVLPLRRLDGASSSPA